jgi:LCP family protein required for cell wall assembly
VSDERPSDRPRLGPQGPQHRHANYYRLPRRRRAWLTLLGWSVWGIIGVVTGLVYAGYAFLDETITAASPDTPEVRAAIRATRPALPGEPQTILLIGSDVRPQEAAAGETGRSDSIILVRMDADRSLISMLSFPRDLYVNVPGYGLTRINEAYATGGAAKTIETVEALTGQSINHFVNLDFEGFERLVDLEGGVYIDVDRRYFNDNAGCTPGAGNCYDTLDLEPGYQRLNGEDALDYVRYRHTDSDYGRIARQQQFLSELKRQTNQFDSLTKITRFAEIFRDNVSTSIRGVRPMLSIIELALTTEDDRIARVRIEGAGQLTSQGASIQVAPESEIQAKVQEWLNPEFESGQPAEEVQPAEISVVVKNGSRRVGAARDLSELLLAEGFQARDAGNVPDRDRTTSSVLYREEVRDAAKQIQGRLGPQANIAVADERELGGGDLMVIVGSDFTGTLAKAPPPEERPDRTAPTNPMVDTTSLVPTFRRLRSATHLDVMVPLKLPSGAAVKRVRAYRINTPGKNDPQAVKVVLSVYARGGTRYFGITETDMEDPPILNGRTGVVPSGGREYATYYDGKSLQRLAWQKDGTTYWLSNTLENDLTDREMYAIVKSMRTLDRAKLPKGATPVEVSVETDASTP